MPNYYLRQYEDLDYIIGIDNIEDISRYYSCVFDTEKISLLYQKPLKSKKNKKSNYLINYILPLEDILNLIPSFIAFFKFI